MKKIAIIPARGGSKGLPGKNIKKLDGLELVFWSVDFALNSEVFGEVIITSDSDEILEVCKSRSVKTVKRPEQMATDESPVIDALLHALKDFKDDDMITLLQPTSPFRSKSVLNKALKSFGDKNSPCVSVKEDGDSPWSAFKAQDEHFLEPLFSTDKVNQRRQDYEKTYHLTGSLYVTKLAWLRDYKNFLKPKPTFVVTNGFENIDIDTLEDFEFAQFVVENRKFIKDF